MIALLFAFAGSYRNPNLFLLDWISIMITATLACIHQLPVLRKLTSTVVAVP